MWRRVLERFRGRSTDRSGNWSDVPASRDHQVDWDTPHDLGLQTVEFVYRTMGIDDEWSIREPRGFTWWGHELAQRVWTEPARMSAGLEVYRLHAETALLRDVGDEMNPSERLAVFNHVASLNAYVWDPAARRVSLHCNVNVHADNVAWLQKILGAAVGIQAADAHIKVGLAEVSGASLTSRRTRGMDHVKTRTTCSVSSKCSLRTAKRRLLSQPLSSHLWPRSFAPTGCLRSAATPGSRH